MAPAIVTAGLGKRYDNGVVGLDDVTLEVPAGTAVALLGQNGAGKSTLMKLVLGFLRPTSGSTALPAELVAVPLVIACAARLCVVIGSRFAARDLLLA